MTTVAEVAINNPTYTFYGPHPCDLCGGGPIIRGSVEQGFGDLRLNYPNEPVYPNHQWKEHKCGCAFQIGQFVEWDGQGAVCAGKITNITNPEPGSYVLWVDVSGTEFYVNASLARALRGNELVKPLVDENDEGLKEFIRDSSALKTKVEHRWSAWLSDREDGIVGTGATEIEAIKALADQHRED